MLGKLGKKFPDWIRKNPVLPWGFLFFAISISVTQFGGTNALSRMAALRAITEAHTFSIDNYKEWTIDWALSPNGHYYSNKAPGPVFLGLPMFALTEAIALPRYAKYHDGKGRAPQPGYTQHLLLMLWLQLVPFFLLVLWICWKLQERGVRASGVNFFALAAFFGNTAAIYMNCNFGHGIASLLFLGAFFYWHERRYVFVGTFLGFSLLSDYGVTFALPFFLLATAWRERKLKSLVEIGMGSLPAAVLWIWYHTVCFGSPFATANQFTNSTQIETLPGRMSLWGEYSPLPSGMVLYQLLFGTSRGILFTQPWVFAVCLFPFLKAPRKIPGLTLLTLGSLGGLLWMNGGFGGWHGGWCVGPRYLSVVFPAMALALVLVWNELPKWIFSRLWVLLVVALVFRIWIYPFSNLAPEGDLWPLFLTKYLTATSHTPTVRIAMALAFIGIALFWQKRRRGFPFSQKLV